MLYPLNLIFASCTTTIVVCVSYINLGVRCSYPSWWLANYVSNVGVSAILSSRNVGTEIRDIRLSLVLCIFPGDSQVTNLCFALFFHFSWLYSLSVFARPAQIDLVLLREVIVDRTPYLTAIVNIVAACVLDLENANGRIQCILFRLRTARLRLLRPIAV